MFSHSACYDNNCEYFPDSSPYDVPAGYDASSSVSDDLFYDIFDNQLGRANKKFSVNATRDWLEIFSEGSELMTPEEIFAARLEKFKDFVKKHFAVVIPQELYGLFGYDAAPYNVDLNARCLTDMDCYFPTGVEGRCDEVSGICRQTCLDDDGCDTQNGFTCSEGYPFDSWLPSDIDSARKHCQKIWDPWDFVGDEYFANEAGKYHPLGLPEWIDEKISENTVVDARHWYWLGKNKAFDPQKALPWLVQAKNTCTYDDMDPDNLVGIAFNEINYVTPTGDGPICIYRNGMSGDSISGAALSDDTIKSLYVSPRYRVCLERKNISPGSEDSAMCLYGGLHGTAEAYLLDWWRGQIESIRWNIVDIDHDGVRDTEDNS